MEYLDIITRIIVQIAIGSACGLLLGFVAATTVFLFKHKDAVKLIYKNRHKNMTIKIEFEKESHNAAS